MKTKKSNKGKGEDIPLMKPNRGGQFLILLFIVYPWIHLLLFPLSSFSKKLKTQPYNLQELLTELNAEFKFGKALNTLSYFTSSQYWILIASLSLPHVFYYLVWTQSRSFFNFALNFKFLGEPFQVMAKIAHVLKLYQLSYFLLYFYPEVFELSKSSQHFQTAMSFVGSQSVVKFIILVQGLFLGQILNGAVYAALGEAGVYYGTRLGKKIPWVTGFPYNVVAHGQYLGATISFVAGCLFLVSDYTIEKGIYGVLLSFIFFYTFSSWVESTL